MPDRSLPSSSTASSSRPTERPSHASADVTVERSARNEPISSRRRRWIMIQVVGPNPARGAMPCSLPRRPRIGRICRARLGRSVAPPLPQREWQRVLSSAVECSRPFPLQPVVAARKHAPWRLFLRLDRARKGFPSSEPSMRFELTTCGLRSPAACREAGHDRESRNNRETTQNAALFRTFSRTRFPLRTGPARDTTRHETTLRNANGGNSVETTSPSWVAVSARN